LREFLKEVDSEEMTFLMHAVAGCCEGTADETESIIKKKQKEREEKREEEKRNQELPTLSGLNFTSPTPVVPSSLCNRSPSWLCTRRVAECAHSSS